MHFNPLWSGFNSTVALQTGQTSISSSSLLIAIIDRTSVTRAAAAVTCQSASGGLTIALDALGQTYMAIASQTGINPALMHRVAVIGSGTLDILPHNGAVVTLLAICGSTHRESYFDIVMVGIVGAIVALAVVIGLGTAFGSF